MSEFTLTRVERGTLDVTDWPEPGGWPGRVILAGGRRGRWHPHLRRRPLEEGGAPWFQPVGEALGYASARHAALAVIHAEVLNREAEARNRLGHALGLLAGDNLPTLSALVLAVEARLDRYRGHALAELGGRAVAEVARLWPGETLEHRGLALAEEAGEVARAILKRQLGHKGTPDEWTRNLRVEVAQVLVVALTIADLEGFDPLPAVLEELDALAARPSPTPVEVAP